MQHPDVYRAPVAQASVPVTAAQEWLRNEHGLAVAPQNAPWPERCVKCNAPADGGRVKQTLYWHKPIIYALILLGPLIYAIVALVVRKSFTAHVGLCKTHRKRRTWLQTAGVFTVFSSMGSCAMMFEGNAGPALSVGTLGIVIGFILVHVGSYVVSAKRIDDAYAWLKCGAPFVQSLPPVGTPAMPAASPHAAMAPGHVHAGQAAAPSGHRPPH